MKIQCVLEQSKNYCYSTFKKEIKGPILKIGVFLLSYIFIFQAPSHKMPGGYRCRLSENIWNLYHFSQCFCWHQKYCGVWKCSILKIHLISILFGPSFKRICYSYNINLHVSLFSAPWQGPGIFLLTFSSCDLLV